MVRREPGCSVRDGTIGRKPLLTLMLLGPVLAGCTASAPDWLSRDADWFQRSGRVFVRSVSIETPPLSPERAVAPDEFVSADGGCPGMAAPRPRANALADGAAGSPPPATAGTGGLCHTQCDAVRGIDAADSVNLSTNPRGD